MNRNLDTIKEKYYSYLDDPTTLGQLESFFYENGWIGNVIGEDNYLEIISLNFRAKDIRFRLADILHKHVGWADYQKKCILTNLHKLLQKTSEMPKILCEIYDLYCDGYYFFEDLGLGYGLCCQCPSIDGRIYDSWDELNEEQKMRILESFYPQIVLVIERAIDWLENSKIELVSKRDEISRMEYIDNRNEAEKKSLVWQTVGTNPDTGAPTKSSNIAIKERKWWKTFGAKR